MQIDLTSAFQESLAKVGGWIEAAIQALPNLVAALVVLLLFVLLARGVRSAVRRVMDRVTDHGPARSLVGTLAYVGVIGAGVFLALGVMDLDKTVTSLLAGVGILGLALGFAFQDIAENFIAGVLMGFRQPFTDGDLIETGDYFGTVTAVDLRATRLRKPSGEMVRIPNADVFGNALTNYSESGARRVDVGCGVSYDDDLEEAARIALSAVEGVEGRDEDREPELFWEEFGGSSVNFTVRFWIPFSNSNATYKRAKSEAMVAVKKAFDAEGVGIPFPIVTLDLSEVDAEVFQGAGS